MLSSEKLRKNPDRIYCVKGEVGDIFYTSRSMFFGKREREHNRFGLAFAVCFISI